MPKVRIYDPKSGFRLWLPLPYRLLVNLCLRRALVLSILDGMVKGLEKELTDCPAESDDRARTTRRIGTLTTLIAAAQTIDFGELRASLTHIEPYKGLVLVDIQAVDGTIVHIAF